MCGNQIDADETGQGGAACQRRGDAAAGGNPFAGGCCQEEQCHTEGEKKFQKLLQGEFPGDCVKCGNATHENKQGEKDHRQAEAF